MNDHIVEDLAFISRLGSYLKLFQSNGNNVWNFRCPVCGDSHQNKYKRRGYLIQDKEMQYRFYCHNCNQTMTLKELLKYVDTYLYQEYVAALFKAKNQLKKKPKELVLDSKSVSSTILESKMIPLSQLGDDHIAVVYMRNRKVPEDCMRRVFWTDHFDEIGNDGFFGGKYQSKKLRTSGIVFKLYTQDLKLCGFQLRSIDPDIPKQYRFQTLTKEKTDGFYGLDCLNKNAPGYVVEGCTDSLFLPNCVAVLNSRLSRFELPGATYLNDNEPRNPQVVSQVEKCVRLGYNVCLLPQKYHGQDVNDLYKTLGCDQKALVELIKQYTFRGLQARIEFARWKR